MKLLTIALILLGLSAVVACATRTTANAAPEIFGTLPSGATIFRYS